MNQSLNIRRLWAASLFFAGTFLAASTAYTQDAAKAAAPTTVTVEAATPIRVILPSLWEEKSSRRLDAAMNQLQR